MRSFCMHLAYFGGGFVGWQRQNEKSKAGNGSIQEEVEDALMDILGSTEKINVTSCSRTDAGTHALYQYATFRVPELCKSLSELTQELNNALPSNIRVHNIFIADNKESNASGSATPSSELTSIRVPRSRFRSRYKQYCYYFQQAKRPHLETAKFSWFLAKKLDISKIREALGFLVGTHDFKNLSQGLQKPEFADKSTVRTIISIRATLRRNVEFSLDPTTCGRGDPVDEDELSNCPLYYVCIELIADGFLRHMVRRIMGTLRPIAEGSIPPTQMQRVLNGEAPAGPSAPSKALWLHRTWLTEEDWQQHRPEWIQETKLSRKRKVGEVVDDQEQQPQETATYDQLSM